MARETVIIGCKLPAGIILEIGLQISVPDPERNSRPITAVKRLDNYQRIVLKGWHGHTEESRRMGLQVPAGMNTSPYLNRNVDKAAWDEWKRTHGASWLLKNEILFEAKDEASAQLKALEGAKTPAIFMPLKRTELPSNIEPADFAKRA